MRIGTLVALAVVAALPLVAHAEPAERTHKLIDAFKAVKTAPEGGKLSDADKAANQKAFANVDSYFDFDAFTQSCLGTNAAKLDAAQQKEFKDRLVDLVRRTGYPNGGTFFAKGEVSEGKPADKNGVTWVPVKVRLVKEDLTTELAFIFAKDKVVDLAIDGDPLTKDYQNQIGRVLGKGGPVDLLKRLQDKQKKLDEARK